MKQAIVLIHGIGEQKPMDTVRSFVESVLPSPVNDDEQYWSKPDPMSESFELRRLQAVGRNKIHFFEYYWAYQISGTKFRHLTQWLLNLLLRRPHNVPSGLRTIWWLSWMLLIGLVAAIASGAVAHFMQADLDRSPYTLISVLLALLLSGVQGFLLYYAGDAARYLSPSPENIALRQRTRADGVALLRRLHESGEYDRIVVVGHSLGSVIGYDILTALWREHNSVYDFESKDAELDQLLANNVRPQPVVRDALSAIGETLRNLPTDDSTQPLRHALQHAYRAAQFACWKEQRYWGNDWRVTDFITLGSPLAHGMMLLARSNAEFSARKRQRELPTCPPVKDGKRYAYSPKKGIETAGKRKFNPLLLHHAACFAVTRWTNMYYPAYGGLCGDLVGGPLAAVFGPGISDIPVKSAGWRRFTPAAHTTYWDKQSDAPASIDAKAAEDFALPSLRQVLRFDHPREYKLPDSVTENLGWHTELIALNARIDDPGNTGAGAANFPADALSELLLFYRTGEPVRGKLGTDGVLEQLKQSIPPGKVITKKIAVTPIGSHVLVTLVNAMTQADYSEQHLRHLRIFSKHHDQWQLEIWHCTEVRDGA